MLDTKNPGYRFYVIVMAKYRLVDHVRPRMAIVVVARLITARRHVTGIMHDTILGPARGPSPQLSANAELQLLTPTALTQLFDMWWFLLADWNTS